MGKVKLSLMNDRFQQPGSLTPSNVRPNRLQDSTEYRDYTPPPGFAGGVCIPFLMKKKIERSDYSNWRTGKVRMDSSKSAPTIDNKGRNFQCGEETRNIKFSERTAKSFDYGANEAARTYYCTPKRMDCPAMNRVLDNLHHVPGETIKDRVDMNKIAGASWSVVARMKHDPTPTAHIGPGHYDIHSFESKYGPLSSNMLLFSVVESGRGVNASADLTDTQRRQQRNKQIEREKNPDKFKEVTYTDDILGATSTLSNSGGKFAKMNRWVDPLNRKEKYETTNGLKLPLDYDPHMDRSKLPITFTTTPQRGPMPELISKNTDYTIDYGKKASMATQAETTPIKYSMAFKSNAPVGMQIPVPTSGKNGGPGAYPAAFKSVTNVDRPDHPSFAFISVKSDSTSCFPTQESSDWPLLSPVKFNEVNRKGPVFPKGVTTNASDVRQKRAENQIKEIYPKLANTIWKKPKAPHPHDVKDPFKHLRPLLK
jgi:hypothetical protein